MAVERDEILGILESRGLSPGAVREWYHTAPVPGFAEQTADDLVSEGKGWALVAYFDAISAGVYA